MCLYHFVPIKLWTNSCWSHHHKQRGDCLETLVGQTEKLQHWRKDTGWWSAWSSLEYLEGFDVSFAIRGRKYIDILILYEDGKERQIRLF